MKKLLFSAIILACSLNQGFAKVETYRLTQQEQTQITEEADNWIDDLPEGYQDRISDAVVHSLAGVPAELTNFRSIKPTPSSEFENVKSEEIFLEGGGIGARYYYAESSKEQKLPLLIYFHGGGWTMGSTDVADNYCKAVAAAGKVKVISLEYPLSPESPADKTVSVCGKTVEEIAGLSETLVFDTENLNIGGDGAGGNLALTTIFSLHKEAPQYKFRSLILYYPILTLYPDTKGEAWRKYGRGYGFDSRVLEAFLQAYNPDAALHKAERDYLMSPLDVEDSYLKMLPPVLMIAPTRDIIIDDEKHFADRLLSLGVNMRMVEFPGGIHGFITNNNQPGAFNKAVALTQTFLQSQAQSSGR